MQAKRFAIINGDDFGFSEGVNQAIIKAHKQGVLTSTSLMVSADAAKEAVTLASAHPTLAVGLHLVLICGRSILPPEQIPHLVDKQGNFSNSPLFAGLRYQFVSQTRQELRQEIRAQLEKYRSTGLPLSHVDGHLHMHMHPVVLRILVDLAPEFDIKVIRLPSEELGLTLRVNRSHLLTKLVWSGVFGRLRRYGEKMLKSQGISFTQRVYGLLQTGGITEEYLLGLIPQIQANLVEIYSHPAMPTAGNSWRGYANANAIHGDPLNGEVATGEAELAALLSDQVREALLNNGFEITNHHLLSQRTT
ncbi:MAG: hopanoid biosynthesis-associated protein HpnK [Nostoc sp. NOS(2021)]|uniref:hopanoid biosynthesis-associated protein HpnK n=1 Tax=Nostoc sp. NOS(2021) TaxID=2815407 RepID=UPI0025FED995|nr:hopanoid biosynthesis-associated protein HpnK [Nostoc sp. NOS(2021)]MBN3895437.1 hopanoid biosynthesis-associated protein HpnK [Nostoc sp. NOS(2021)]